MDGNRRLFLSLAILLSVVQFSFAQGSTVAPLMDSQDSKAVLSAAAAEGSAGRSAAVRPRMHLGYGGDDFTLSDCLRSYCASMPSFRWVDAAALPPPSTPKQAFVIAMMTYPNTIPDTAVPQTEVSETAEISDQQPAVGQSQNAQSQQPASSSAPQDTWSSQTSAQQPSRQQSQHEKAQEEVKEQEKQRVVGIVPTFNLTYHHDAVPLSAGQKMNLALHSSFDLFTIASSLMEAGYHEGVNDLSGFSWGAKGYGERVGVAYLDTFDGTVLSNAVFPIIFRQDPRYFRLGYGTILHRVFYSLATNFIAKNDYNGKWGPNYGNVLGNMAAGAVSNLYYPNSNASFRLTVTTGIIQIAEGAGGSIFNEFWPDISRRLLHRDPTHGLDAQVAAEERAKRQGQKTQSPGPTQK